MFAIETRNLTKNYAGEGGCRDISLAVPTGTIFGLLGPNGAGKSTLVKMLVGLLQPTSGEAYVLNRPLQDLATRKKVGFLPENFRYHDWLSGIDLLEFHGRLFGLSKPILAKRIPEVLEMVCLFQHRHKRVGSYSKGMQQRIGLGCALLPDPDLLFLDEPTSALDPIGRKMVRDLITQLRDQGKTIFLNSHLLSELETVCEHIAIIREGSLLYQGNWRELASHKYKLKIILGSEVTEDISQYLPESITVISRNKLNDTEPKTEIILTCSDEQEIPQLLRNMIQAGINLYEVTPILDSLEKLFLETITQKGQSEGR